MRQTKIGAAFVALGILASSGCRPDTPPPSETVKTRVRLAAVEVRDVSETVHTFGRLASKKEMKLSFKIGGIIDRIFVDEGAAVASDQTLARLNLSEIEAEVRQARSAFEKAERDKQRIENLYSQKAVTLEQMQNVQTAYQVAQSRLRAAEFNLRYAEIRSPGPGRILKRLAEENEIVPAGMPVFLFASTEGDWIVRAGVSDSDLVRLRRGDPAEVIFDAYPETKFRSRVEETAQAADPLTGAYEVELRLVDPDKRLVSGFVAQIDIFPSDASRRFIIPIEALVEAQGSRGYVFTVDPATTTARRVEVTIAFVFGDRVAVDEGLEGITDLVTDGAAYLKDGDAVDVIDRSAEGGGIGR